MTVTLIATPERRPSSWNDSTMVVQLIRDRMRDQGWSAAHTMELPVYGPAPALERRAPDLGIGLWR